MDAHLSPQMQHSETEGAEMAAKSAKSPSSKIDKILIDKKQEMLSKLQISHLGAQLSTQMQHSETEGVEMAAKSTKIAQY